MKRARVLGLLLVLVGLGFGVPEVRGQEPGWPAPWSEVWAAHPLNVSPYSIAFPVLSNEDTFISPAQPDQNFGTLTYGEIADGRRALIKFNLADVPTQGKLPIQEIYLAIALVDTVPYSFWMGVTDACTPWQETAAAWNNANCNPAAARTTYPDAGPHWEFISLWQPAITPAENGYFLFDTSNGPLRRFLTREAGEEWAPRLIVTYARDTQPPTLSGFSGASGPEDTLLMSPGWEFNLSLSDDAGLAQLIFERETKSTGEKEAAATELERGCTAGLYNSKSISLFPFVERPLGKHFRYQAILEDCLGKQSAPIVFDNLLHVKRIEYAYLRDFTDQPLGAGKAMRRDDRGSTELLPASDLYGHGETTHFGSISDSAEYWVDAPGFPSGSEGVLEGEFVDGSPATGIRLYVPWQGAQVIRQAGTEVRQNETLQIPLHVPWGEQVVVATTADVFGEVGEEETPGGNARITLEEAGGAPSTVVQSYVYGSHPPGAGYPVFLAGELVQWAGQPVTLTISFTPNGGKDWAMRLNEIVVSAQNPDLAVVGQSLVTPVDALSAGIEMPIAWRVGQVRATQPTTLTLAAPRAVALSDFSQQPTGVYTETDQVRYEWVMPKLLAGNRVFTTTISVQNPGSYALELSIVNERDPNLTNNQARIDLRGSQTIVYLPVVTEAEK